MTENLLISIEKALAATSHCGSEEEFDRRLEELRCELDVAIAVMAELIKTKSGNNGRFAMKLGRALFEYGEMLTAS